MSLSEYKVLLVPNTITMSNNVITDTDQQIIDKLKVNNLYLKIINFYTRLKIANQRVSEGKETCPVRITWTPQNNTNIPAIVCLQIRYLLSVINPTNPFGKVLELSAQYLQDLKFYNNFSRNGLVYKKKFT
tara:strand:- start:287 stop:679 length:393 start_codon:yes stop_codon:yes gene_type:complete